MRGTPSQRFWAKVDKQGKGGCWIWTGSHTTSGYGHFVFKPGVTELAHRIAYREMGQTLSDDKELHHTCRNRACVNPAHLEALTRMEHMGLASTMEGGQTMAFYVSNDQVALIRDLAKKEGVSVSEVVRWAIDEYGEALAEEVPMGWNSPA